MTQNTQPPTAMLAKATRVIRTSSTVLMLLPELGRNPKVSVTPLYKNRATAQLNKSNINAATLKRITLSHLSRKLTTGDFGSGGLIVDVIPVSDSITHCRAP
jgi:hypothetical protein